MGVSFLRREQRSRGAEESYSLDGVEVLAVVVEHDVERRAADGRSDVRRVAPHRLPAGARQFLPQEYNPSRTHQLTRNQGEISPQCSRGYYREAGEGRLLHLVGALVPDGEHGDGVPGGEQLLGDVEPDDGVPAAVGVDDQHALLGLRAHRDRRAGRRRRAPPCGHRARGRAQGERRPRGGPARSRGGGGGEAAGRECGGRGGRGGGEGHRWPGGEIRDESGWGDEWWTRD
jgi:hypothetical protein